MELTLIDLKFFFYLKILKYGVGSVSLELTLIYLKFGFFVFISKYKMWVWFGFVLFELTLILFFCVEHDVVENGKW